MGGDTALYKAGYAVGNSPRLSGACACDYQEGPFLMQNSLLLSLI